MSEESIQDLRQQAFGCSAMYSLVVHGSGLLAGSMVYFTVSWHEHMLCVYVMLK